jgi:Uri superfamily endonuclease
MQNSVILIGDDSLGGTYLLRLRAAREVAVQFGRFRQGALVVVPAGDCLYIGSAMRGLGARLLRHASRTDAANPHTIRAEMMAVFVDAGLVKGIRPFPAKRLHWHIDYLLERSEVTLTHAIALRSDVRLETAVADWLTQDPTTFIIAPGLGAQDDPGRTHLLGVKADETWCRKLPSQMLLLAQAVQPVSDAR